MNLNIVRILEVLMGLSHILLMIKENLIKMLCFTFMVVLGSKDPLENHFDFIDQLAGELDARVIMPVYPKVPHRDYRTTFELLKIFIKKKY